MPRIKVLLVDDEETLLEATKFYLEEINTNIEITPANSAKEALRLANIEPFDVIVSDFQMPDMDGLYLL
ncbi:MAG: response regulator, partial [Candidatus Thorarchaeota archaeon]